MIEKILSKFREIGNIQFSQFSKPLIAVEDAIQIVQEVAKEYGNGWIPCSERLPSKEEYRKCNGQFIVSDGNRTYATYFDIYDTLKFGEPTIERFRIDKCVIAWQPLPAPYQKAPSRCDTCTHYVANEVPPICYMCSKGIEDNYERKGE